MEITRVGQKTVDSLNGKLAFEQDNNRIIGRDAAGVIRMRITAENEQFSVNFYDSAGVLVSSYDSVGLKFFDSAGVPRSMFTPTGIKIAQNGIDVTTATASQLIFNSAQNIFKIVSTGLATVNVPNGYTSYEVYTTRVTHSLGNTPMVLGSVDTPVASGEGRRMLPTTMWDTSNVFAFQAGFILFDNYFDCYVSARSGSGGSEVYKGNYTFRYYILAETAAT